MAASVNKVILIGRVGKDPVIKSFQSGDRVANFSIATSEKWKDKSTGERKEKTEWHNLAVFNSRLVEICEKYVRKGALIHIEGQLATRKWTNQNGQENYTTEVVLKEFRGELNLLESKREAGEESTGGGGSDEYNTSTSTGRQDKRGNPQPESDDYLDDPIPF